MVRQTMEEKVKGILDANACKYDNTQGNTIFFFTMSLTGSGEEYKQEAEIHDDNTLTWECECLAYTHSKADPKTCKHVGSAKEVLKNDDSIRVEYKMIVGDSNG